MQLEKQNSKTNPFCISNLRNGHCIEVFDVRVDHHLHVLPMSLVIVCLHLLRNRYDKWHRLETQNPLSLKHTLTLHKPQVFCLLLSFVLPSYIWFDFPLSFSHSLSLSLSRSVSMHSLYLLHTYFTLWKSDFCFSCFFFVSVSRSLARLLASPSHLCDFQWFDAKWKISQDLVSFSLHIFFFKVFNRFA